jgi:hypothetical protein
MEVALKPGLPRLNLGLIFVRTFRWLLLLLFSLVLEKGAEGVMIRMLDCETPYLAKDMSPFTVPLQLNYLGGVAQLVILMLFVLRYFFCLVDPLERAARLDEISPQEITPRVLRHSLARITEGRIVYVFAISLGEFILLLHASMSFKSPDIFLVFLWLLVAFDSIIFMIVPRLLLYQAQLTHSREFVRMLYRLIKAFFNARKNGGDAVAKARENFDDWAARNGPLEENIQIIDRTIQSYGKWNAVDFLLLSFGMAVCCSLRLSGEITGTEKYLLYTWLPVLLAVLFSVATYCNYRTQRNLWQRHFLVLSR